jgi:hypothetical protein
MFFEQLCIETLVNDKIYLALFDFAAEDKLLNTYLVILFKIWYEKY